VSSSLAQRILAHLRCMKRVPNRRGARHLCAGLSVADGTIYGTCRQRTCVVDVQTFVKHDIIPEALRRQVQTIILILDNGTRTRPNSLKSGFMSTRRLLKDDCTSRWTGCRLTRPGSIRSTGGSACFSAHVQLNHFLSTDA
jgi:hypothetical protein